MTDFQMSNEKFNNTSLNTLRNTDQKRIFSKNINSTNNSLDDKILNKVNLKSKIIASLTKYGLNKTNFIEVETIISLGLEEYLKNMIENLIKISRVRNLNLNLYSKLAEKNQVFYLLHRLLKSTLSTMISLLIIPMFTKYLLIKIFLLFSLEI